MKSILKVLLLLVCLWMLFPALASAQDIDYIPKGRYLVIGTFHMKDNAIGFTDYVKQMDKYEVKMSYHPIKKYYYVYIKGYQENESGSADVDRMRKQTEFIDTWYMVVEPYDVQGDNTSILQTTSKPLVERQEPLEEVADVELEVEETNVSDGWVRAASPDVAGQEVTRAEEKVIDIIGVDGKVIGSVGDDGKVIGTDGKVIGTLGAYGQVIDADGIVIGVVGADRIAIGTGGNVIGTLEEDGKVIDANGKVIGILGASKQVIGAEGKVLGIVVANGEVLGADGKVIGTVGADGKMRDAGGKVIGAVGTFGQVIGAGGKVIGMVGADGKVIGTGTDSSVIGTVRTDGKVIDGVGKIIGAVGAFGQVVDADGVVIGTVGANGRVVGGLPPEIIRAGLTSTSISKLSIPISKTIPKGYVEKGNYKLYFNTYYTKNFKEVTGLVDIINPKSLRLLRAAQSLSLIMIRDPNNGDHSIQLIANIFGYKKVQHDIKLDEPFNDVNEEFFNFKGDTLVVNFPLQRYETGDIATMYNVFFFKDAAIMKPNSKFEINSLVDMLKENDELKIKIHGHTNGNASGKIITPPQSSEEFFSLNQEVEEKFGSAKELSKQRAEVIKRYLMYYGIAANRMEVIGWGGKKPIYDKMDKLAVKNVRVEIEILDN